tara:strand:+ start:278 stop:457 length:180 start_codon:yes stop_codon:yes gene_type:complete
METQLDISHKPITDPIEELLRCNEVLLFSDIKIYDEQITEYESKCVVYLEKKYIWISID